MHRDGGRLFCGRVKRRIPNKSGLVKVSLPLIPSLFCGNVHVLLYAGCSVGKRSKVAGASQAPSPSDCCSVCADSDKPPVCASSKLDPIWKFSAYGCLPAPCRLVQALGCQLQPKKKLLCSIQYLTKTERDVSFSLSSFLCIKTLETFRPANTGPGCCVPALSLLGCGLPNREGHTTPGNPVCRTCTMQVVS